MEKKKRERRSHSFQGSEEIGGREERILKEERGGVEVEMEKRREDWNRGGGGKEEDGKERCKRSSGVKKRPLECRPESG